MSNLLEKLEALTYSFDGREKMRQIVAELGTRPKEGWIEFRENPAKDKRIVELEADKAELVDALLDVRSYACMAYPEQDPEYEDDIALIDEIIAKYQQPTKETQQ
jgi:hypothetical protein